MWIILRCLTKIKRFSGSCKMVSGNFDEWLFLVDKLETVKRRTNEQQTEVYDLLFTYSPIHLSPEKGQTEIQSGLFCSINDLRFAG